MNSSNNRSNMSPTLIINLPGQAARQIELTRERYRIGRDADSDIVLPAEVVSRRHATLERKGGVWLYTDSDSRNGTRLNGQRIKQVDLQDGMSLQIGENQHSAVKLTFRLAVRQSASAQPSTNATVIEARESTTGLVQMRSVYSSSAQSLIIGRVSEADIPLPSPLVSRRHASLQASQPEWMLTDLNSKNGTFLNGARVTHSQRLKQGDLIQIGPFRIVYEGHGKINLFAASRGLRLDGLGLTWDVGKGSEKKRILHDVNISCYPQEFIGLVGGSGAGKSTLMKALSGLLPMTGQALVEGDDLYKNFGAYRALIGYVPQDDILHTELTVEQALKYSAHLRLPPDISDGEIKGRVERVLGQVELQAQRSTPIKKLSGGQRKRASIAVELLADPPLFFLDEPTSGLDPGLERKMMVTLRKLADGGKTIVLVTHATANITECHQVAFMSMGKLVYYGPPQQAGEFFGVGGDSFADIYTQISDAEPKAAIQKADTWERRFRLSDFFKKYVTERFKSIQKTGQNNASRRPGQRISVIGSIYQFLILTQRYFALVLRDKMLMTILLAVMPLLACLILGISEQNWLTGDTLAAVSQQLNLDLASGEQSASYLIVGSSQKLLFIMALTAVMLGLFSSSYEIVKEKSIYQRERMVSLQLIPYLASKVFLLGAFAALQCLLFLFVISWKVTFPEQGVLLPAYVEMYVTLFLGVLTAISMGLFISSVAPNENTVTYIIMGVLFLQITFAGVIFDLPGFTKSLSSLTLTRWTMEGLGVTADLENLDTLSLTRFQPDPVTQDVSVEVEKPDPDWSPVTVTTEMKQFPGCSDLVPMTTVVENELVTVNETVTESVTVDPDPLDIMTPYGFTINYEHSSSHLISDWGMLFGLSLLFMTGTLIALKSKDIT